jgi:hypothetical protein
LSKPLSNFQVFPAFLIVFAIAIYLAALSPGNWPADIALMTAFP